MEKIVGTVYYQLFASILYNVHMDKRYQARIERVIQYIEENLGQKLSLHDIAEVSHFSQYHFHRIFRGIMGETLNDYISRRRLESAANLLAFSPHMTITEIALATGFSSSANFAKAVKLYFGYSPSEIRNPSKVKDSKIGKVFSKYGKDFHPANLYPYHDTAQVLDDRRIGGSNPPVVIKELECQPVSLLASPHGYELDSLFNTWEQLMAWATAQGIPDAEQNRYAFCYDNPAVTPFEKCRYEAAIVIESDVQVSFPFTKSEIMAGQYAVLHYKGSPDETNSAQLSLYAHWFPYSGYEPDRFPMLERYLNDVREDGYVEMEIYVKLRNLPLFTE
ncbi:MAG: GyrI-like domain-containing protein [Chloroflexota bacterium]